MSDDASYAPIDLGRAVEVEDIVWTPVNNTGKASTAKDVFQTPKHQVMRPYRPDLDRPKLSTAASMDMWTAGMDKNYSITPLQNPAAYWVSGRSGKRPSRRSTATTSKVSTSKVSTSKVSTLLSSATSSQLKSLGTSLLAKKPATTTVTSLPFSPSLGITPAPHSSTPDTQGAQTSTATVTGASLPFSPSLGMTPAAASSIPWAVAGTTVATGAPTPMTRDIEVPISPSVLITPCVMTDSNNVQPAVSATSTPAFLVPPTPAMSMQSSHVPASVVDFTPLKPGAPLSGPTGAFLSTQEPFSQVEEGLWQDAADQWKRKFNDYIKECDEVEL
eukprot:TRINITY_DN2006_c2_g1_i1.p1 TRINITY_DN2006_c2_g1~~TRINITY_DN2006_c2_g1_i1.p1  ORF type:complete len:351 (+),score=45.38 TRINITY_DN2006_c2_g1_i1:62-1054(+)